MEERYFDDDDIVEQSACMIERMDGTITNGISCVVNVKPGIQSVEIVLEYDELKKALAELDMDRKAGVVEYK